MKRNETKKNPARINSLGRGFMFHFNLCSNPDIVAAFRGVVEAPLAQTEFVPVWCGFATVFAEGGGWMD